MSIPSTHEVVWVSEEIVGDILRLSKKSQESSQETLAKVLELGMICYNELLEGNFIEVTRIEEGERVSSSITI